MLVEKMEEMKAAASAVVTVEMMGSEMAGKKVVYEAGSWVVTKAD